jgi:hypothetical protein
METTDCLYYNVSRCCWLLVRLLHPSLPCDPLNALQCNAAMLHYRHTVGPADDYELTLTTEAAEYNIVV